ncbi:hypothetical protein VOLCADRAFT_89655 [Volvox carteri f. nagariensis]|uniref:NAD(P)-binding domain-containing protein n=1 Tax=Volvox carteri f. nagariensis TaxID=3068 RepID=D8TSF3_VOLCA|nr:uncharacterized protein VOLCADRAFT_89655 [Volvox carteri f. nagariensis]EFJ49811.1 hypothetical protein VOLCADRAFT_89655 [Volvox carteri f. nagariensis]|eukprot:XP_002949318.1 hypothetical protein VOLCADRAFT_89655 [Volvox carteri f. nagariensis]
MAAESQSLAGVNVVLGAGGRTGLECVKRLVAVSDLPTRAVLRDPTKLAGVLEPNSKLQIVKGNVTDEASLREVLKDARGVIFAAAGTGYWSASDVDFKGVEKVAAVSKELGVRRVVLVSSMLVTRKHWLHPIRLILNNIRYGLMDNKLRGEDALRSSGVEYTIIRPGGLGNGPGGHVTFVTGQGDVIAGAGSINRADVASVCVSALTHPGAANITLELFSRPGLPEGGYEAALEAVWKGLKPGLH